MSAKVAGSPAISFGSWWTLGVLLLFSVLSFIDRTFIVMLVDPIKADLGLTDFEMSLILGPAFGVFFAIASLPSGWAADHLPRRWVIFAGVFLWSLTTMLCGLANSFAALFVARMFVAVGEASLGPAGYSLIGDKFPPHRLTTAMAIFSMGPKGGQSVAFIVGGILIGVTSAWGVLHLPGIGAVKPWQMVFILVGAPGMLLAFLALTFREPSRAERRAEAINPSGLLDFLKSRRSALIPMWIGFCCVGIANGAMSGWVATFMTRVHGWTPAQYGPAIGIVSAAAALTLIPKGLAVDWLYARGHADAPLRFYTWLLAAFTPLAPLSYFVPSPYAFLVMYGLSAAVALPLMLYAAATMQLLAPPDLRGRLNGIIIFVVPIFMYGFGPPLVGALNDFVFHDPKSVGVSTAIVVGIAMTGGLVSLRFTLRQMTPFVKPPSSALAPASA